MVTLRLAPGFEQALQEQLNTPQGRAAIDQLAEVIARDAAHRLPAEILSTLDTPEGRQALEEAWPEIVDAFLHRREVVQSGRAPRKLVDQGG